MEPLRMLQVLATLLRDRVLGSTAHRLQAQRSVLESLKAADIKSRKVSGNEEPAQNLPPNTFLATTSP